MRTTFARYRTLIFLFGGFFIMYLGVYIHPLMPATLVIGTILVLSGFASYFFVGPAGRGHLVHCPRCGYPSQPHQDAYMCPRCKLSIRRNTDGSYQADLKQHP